MDQSKEEQIKNLFNKMFQIFFFIMQTLCPAFQLLYLAASVK